MWHVGGKKYSLLISLLLIGILTSCAPELRLGAKSSGRAGLSNSPSRVGANSSLVMQLNPVAKSGNRDVNYLGLNLALFLDPTPVLITANNSLTESCSLSQAGIPYSINPCFNVYESSSNVTALTKNAGTWAYEPNTSEFLQVQTFYHMKKSIERFHEILDFVKNQSTLFTGLTSIPSTLITDRAFWKSDNINGIYSTLTGYSKCGDFANAYFDATQFELCFGNDPDRPGLIYSQDPSIIHHEVQHAFTWIMANARNITNGVTARYDLGALGYDEAGAINEGISDYFSYVIDGRDEFGEWALGKDYHLNRPLSEDNTLHAPGIDTSSSGRLSYPQFLTYEYNAPGTPIEDIHDAGQITSHYLVALTKKLQSVCGISHKISTNYVMYMLSETLAELGDLSAEGIDGTPMGYFTNTDPDAAVAMARTGNPANYFTFYQTFARNLGRYVSSNLCVGFSKDMSEQLLDDYGLLLFKTYNNDGGDSILGHNGTVHATSFTSGKRTTVNDANRIKSVTIPKSYLQLGSNPQAYVVDSQADMRKLLQGIQQQTGGGVISTLTPSDLSFNNGNGQISPGEVLGVHLNLKNTSNSTMAGIQVLGNDWDHTRLDSQKRKPCNNFEDAWPSYSAGGVDDASAYGGPFSAGTNGNCDRITRTDGQAVSDPDPTHPVCFVSVIDTITHTSRWVSQTEVFETTAGPNVNFTVPHCLDDNKPSECLLRVLPPYYAEYAKLDSQKNLLQTLQGMGTNPTLNASALVVMEVNKYVPIGTQFMCRFRVRFSNCQDCYQDENNNDDNFLGFENSGAAPFKIIDLPLTIGF